MPRFARISPALLSGLIAGVILGTAGTVAGAALLGSSVFPDVPSGSFYDAAIGTMYDAGIIRGYDNGTFGPNDPVTRGQLAVMLKRLRDDLTGTAVSSATDSSDEADASSSTARSSRSSSSSTVPSSRNPHGTFRFTSASWTAQESVGTVIVSVVRTGGNAGSASVTYTVAAGTATAGSDFTAATGTLNFEDEETSKTFTVAILDDGTSEGNETVTITLSSPTNGATITTPTTATLTIVDNEAGTSSVSSASSRASSAGNAAGTLSFSALTYGEQENAGTLTISVVRSGGSTGTVGVSYATVNGSATAGAEFSATNGTLSFAAGETSKTFTVAIIDDQNIDGSKNFTVTLTTPTGGAVLGTPASAVVTSYDNESLSMGSGSLKFAKSVYDILESAGKADIVVQRVGGTQGTVSVNYATMGSTATSGTDFTHTSGTLTFAPGETSKSISIPILRDTTSDTGEYFTVDLSGQTSTVQLISPYTATVNLNE